MASVIAASALVLAPRLAGAQTAPAAVAPVFRVHVVADPGVRVDSVRGGATFRLHPTEISHCTRLPCDVLVGRPEGWDGYRGVHSQPWLQIDGDDGASELVLGRDAGGATVRVHRAPRLRFVLPLGLTGLGLAALGAGLWTAGMVQSGNNCPSGSCDAWRDSGLATLGAGIGLGVATFLVYAFVTPPRTSVERPAAPQIGFAPTRVPAGLGVGMTLRM